MRPKLSVIIPVYNEIATIELIVKKIGEVPVDKEIVIVEDGSSDGTRQLVERLFGSQEGIRVIFHPENAGKGAAIRTGIAAAAGEAVIIQDADLEYDPADYAKLVETMERAGAHVVYGSRFLDAANVDPWWHRAVNRFLTWLTNILYGSRLTDMETCYKLVRSDLLRELKLESQGFEIEVEITSKLLKRREKIVEAPIAYNRRSYHEGKKIGWMDGVKAILWLFRYRFAR